MTTSLAQDRPTIDAAVKSFMSLICARSLTTATTTTAKILPPPVSSSSSSDQEVQTQSQQLVVVPSNAVQPLVLQLARAILQSVNAYTFPIHSTVAHVRAEHSTTKPTTMQKKPPSYYVELSVVARLWNGLVESNQKPSRYLGGKALKHAWKDLNITENLVDILQKNTNVDNDRNRFDEMALCQQWLNEFEQHLNSCHPLPKSTTTSSTNESSIDEKTDDNGKDDDAALIWAPDGGKAELAQRRQRRQDSAKQRGPSTPS